MAIRVALRGLLVLVGPGGAVAQGTSAVPPLVFEGVTVVDVAPGKLIPNQRVVIAGHHIQSIGTVGSVQMPMGAQVVEARGQYLIPGLWDMHAHNAPGLSGLSGNLTPPPSVAKAADRYTIYLAYGITGIRDMGTSLPLDSLRIWRRAVATGHRAGPRVFFSGPYVDSDKDPSWGGLTRVFLAALPATTPEEARRTVDTLKAAGADFIKVHEDAMARENFFALAAEARRLGIPFAGHLPQAVTMAEASDSGMRSLEHWWSFTGWGTNGPCAQTDSMGSWPADSAGQAHRRQCGALIATLQRNGTWLSPNFVTEDTTVRALRFIHAVRPFGLPFLVGTDIVIMGSESDRHAPLGVHHEMALFVKAGMTPAEALRAATLNPALALGAADSLSTVAPGKLADLVLLDANPLVDIANTTTIRAVVANGRYYDRRTLDVLLSPAAPASAAPAGHP